MEVISSFHNLQFNARHCFHPSDQLSAVAAISPELFEERLFELDTFEKELCSISILHARTMNNHLQN